MNAIPLSPDLKTNRDRYRRIVDLARTAGPTDANSTLAYIGAAADSAWLHHPGFFTDRDLEGLAVGAPSASPATRTSSKRDNESVLHVITQAQEIGGHTRLAARWMELDPDRKHSVVLTAQDTGATPQSLKDVVRARGGSVHHLDRRPGGLASRGARLKRLAADFDYTVLHTHPSDPVPLAAFRTARYSPVLLLNHADHVFWLGASAADVVVSIREAGRTLCLTRRGIHERKTALLPIPVPPAAAPSVSKAAAKRRLGIPADSVLILTIASGYKFATSADPEFASLHADFLASNPSFYHLVVGVAPGSAPWTSASAQTNGRLTTVSPTPDLADTWAAADLYADSFPFASLTSVLEAMSHGIPCVSFDPFGGSSPVLRLGDAQQMALFYEGSDIGAYEAALKRLGNEPLLRQEAGETALDVIRARHWGEGWRRQLEATYAAARRENAAEGGGPIDSAPEGAPTDLDRNLVTLQSAQSATQDADDLVSGPLLSALTRRQAMRATGIPHNRQNRARLALPAWTMFVVGRAARAIRAFRPPRMPR